MQIFTEPPKDFDFSINVSCCYVNSHDKILLLKRADNHPDQHYWCVPGGKREQGETPKEAALRELREETGLNIHQNAMTKVGQLYIRRPHVDYVFYMFRAQLNECTPISLSNEHISYKWIIPDELQTLPLMPGGIEAFRYYQEFLSNLQLSKANVNVFLIPRKGEQILLALRANTGYCDGQYGLISGHVEYNESAQTALIREIQEEAGLTLKPEQLTLIHCLHLKADRNNISLFFLCTEWEGEFVNKEPHKCDGFTYFPLNNLPSNTVSYLASVLHNIQNGIFYSEYGWST